MIRLISRLFPRGEPILSDASARDAASIAMLHNRSFRRGWSEEEVESLLLERNVFGHRAMAGRKFAGFILSRLAADEAEILSVAVERAWRGRGVGRRLLALHLGRLAGFGTRTVFLEVGEDNGPAANLYARAGFREVARRPNYYGGTGTTGGNALVLRRDLVQPEMDTSSGASI